MTTDIAKASPTGDGTSEAVLTVADAARFLRVSESVVRRLIRERRIPFFRIDGRYLLFRPSVEEWIRGKTVPPEGLSCKQESHLIANQLMEDGR